MLSLLTGTMGKVVGIAMLALSLMGAAAAALHVHDNAVRAEMQVSSDLAIATAQAADKDHEVAALENQAVANVASLNRLSAIKEKTHAAPITTGCVSSPAVQSLLDGLRNGHPNHPGTAR